MNLPIAVLVVIACLGLWRGWQKAMPKDNERVSGRMILKDVFWNLLVGAVYAAVLIVIIAAGIRLGMLCL